MDKVAKSLSYLIQPDNFLPEIEQVREPGADERRIGTETILRRVEHKLNLVIKHQGILFLPNWFRQYSVRMSSSLPMRTIKLELSLFIVKTRGPAWRKPRQSWMNIFSDANNWEFEMNQ